MAALAAPPWILHDSQKHRGTFVACILMLHTLEASMNVSVNSTMTPLSPSL